MKCANENARPKRAAYTALSRLDPSIQTSGTVATSGVARRRSNASVMGFWPETNATRSFTLAG